MKTYKLRKKTTTFSLVLLVLITLMFLVNGLCVLADESNETNAINNPEDNSLEISSYVNYMQAIYPEASSIVVPNEDITITPPTGSKITNISSTSIDIQLSNGSKTINFSDTIESISKISFHKSIDGLDDFNVKINFADYATKSNLDKNIINIVNYTIDWGNGDITRGEGIPSSTISYTYKKEGTYPISIKLTDSSGITYTYEKKQSFKLTTVKFVQLWVDENKETVAVSSVGIGGIALLGFALTETGKYKFLALLPLLIPMYTRIQKEDVLDQFVRGEIYGFIKANPGVHYNQIIRELDMKNGTLSYHLHMLEKTGMVKSRKEGFRYRVFYPTGMKFPEKERYRLTELQLNMIKTIKEKEGISQKEIAKRLNVKHQTINYNVKVLQQAGLISLRKKGRKTSCYIQEDISHQET